MRTHKELFEVLLKHEWVFRQQCNGLCRLIDDLRDYNVLRDDEASWLKYYVYANRPEPFTRHYSLFYNTNGYYWKRGAWKPRERWLKTQIKKAS